MSPPVLQAPYNHLPASSLPSLVTLASSFHLSICYHEPAYHYITGLSKWLTFGTVKNKINKKFYFTIIDSFSGTLSFLMEIQVCFNTWNILLNSLLACTISDKKLALIPILIPLLVIIFHIKNLPVKHFLSKQTLLMDPTKFPVM